MSTMYESRITIYPFSGNVSGPNKMNMQEKVIHYQELKELEPFNPCLNSWIPLDIDLNRVQ